MKNMVTFDKKTLKYYNAVSLKYVFNVHTFTGIKYRE